MDMARDLPCRAGSGADRRGRALAKKSVRRTPGEAVMPRVAAAGILRLAIPHHYRKRPRLRREALPYPLGAVPFSAFCLAGIRSSEARASRIGAAIGRH